MCGVKIWGLVQCLFLGEMERKKRGEEKRENVEGNGGRKREVVDNGLSFFFFFFFFFLFFFLIFSIKIFYNITKIKNILERV